MTELGFYLKGSCSQDCIHDWQESPYFLNFVGLRVWAFILISRFHPISNLTALSDIFKRPLNWASLSELILFGFFISLSPFHIILQCVAGSCLDILRYASHSLLSVTAPWCSSILLSVTSVKVSVSGLFGVYFVPISQYNFINCDDLGCMQSIAARLNRCSFEVYKFYSGFSCDTPIGACFQVEGRYLCRIPSNTTFLRTHMGVRTGFVVLSKD